MVALDLHFGCFEKVSLEFDLVVESTGLKDCAHVLGNLVTLRILCILSHLFSLDQLPADLGQFLKILPPAFKKLISSKRDDLIISANLILPLLLVFELCRLLHPKRIALTNGFLLELLGIVDPEHDLSVNQVFPLHVSYRLLYITCGIIFYCL